MKKIRVFLVIVGLICFVVALYIALPIYPVRQPSEWPVQNPTVHFSIDDAHEVCASLQDGNKNSIFDDSLLSILKYWHDKYGMVASIYVQGPFLVNSCYADEIISNSNWLRWGYHGVGNQRRKTGIGSFTRQVRDSIGNTNIIDNTVRVDYYHADLLTCIHYRLYGYKAFYTADDWSYNAKDRMTNYYLSSSQSDSLETEDILYDALHDITFIKTDFRVEQITLPILEAHIQRVAASNSNNPDLLILFTHERFLVDNLEKIDSLFSVLHNNGYKFGFPY